MIPFGGKKGSQQIEDEVKKSLEGVEGEIIFSETWQDGKALAKGEFISFLTPTDIPPANFFAPLLFIFSSQSSYRKLALVAPMPQNMHSLSLEPYPVRVAPLPGAVVRKSAFKDCTVKLTGDSHIDSYNLSVDFWNRGLRCYIHPGVKFGSETVEPDLTDLVEPDPKVLMLWKREMI